MLSENLISASVKYIILSVFWVLIVCILIACFAGSHRWEILLSFSTLLVAIVALLLAVFQDDIQTLRHKPDIAIYVGENLAAFEHGKVVDSGHGYKRWRTCSETMPPQITHN